MTCKLYRMKTAIFGFAIMKHKSPCLLKLSSFSKMTFTYMWCS